MKKQRSRFKIQAVDSWNESEYTPAPEDAPYTDWREVMDEVIGEVK